MPDLVRKVGYWWINNVVIPMELDLDEEIVNKINPENTYGSDAVFLGVILSVFDGNDNYLRNLYNDVTDAWKKEHAKQKSAQPLPQDNDGVKS
jgi:hypothetical protein